MAQIAGWRTRCAGLLCVLALFVWGCRGGHDPIGPEWPDLQLVTAGLRSGVEQVGYGPEQLIASGGDGGFTWMIYAGSLPAGLVLDSGGTISGVPVSVGTSEFRVLVRSGDGQRAIADLAITVNPVLSVTTPSLPSGVRDEAYGAALSTMGGSGTGSWSVASGHLPAGMTLHPSGGITGTPTESGTFSFTVAFSSSDGQSAQRAFDLTVTDGLAITTATLPTGIENTSYAGSTLGAVGGDGTYSWAIRSGALPSGLVLDSRGEVTGVPATSGTSTFTVEVTSGDGQVRQHTFSIWVHATLAVATDVIPRGFKGRDYGIQRVVVNGGSGSGTWSIVSGSLPTGLSIDPEGDISGVPTEVGSSLVALKFMDTDGQEAEREYSVDVLEPLEITTDVVPSGITTKPYSARLEASGGEGALEWFVVAGSLPPGLTLDPSGNLTGTPTSTANSQFTAEVRSADGQVSNRVFELAVHGILTVTSSALPAALENAPYGPTSLTATGGTAPHDWSISSGALPPGLTLAADGVIQGTSADVGDHAFVVRVTSDDGQTAERPLSITVDARPVLTPTERCIDFPSYAVASFADLNLENVVRSSLGVDAYEPLTCSVVATLTVISQGEGSNAGIVSLDGIQNLTGLATLWLASNAISDVTPLADLSELNEVHLQHNQVSDVNPLAGLTGLTFLSLWDNDVTDINPLASLTALAFLQLAHNHVSDVSALQGMVHLETLRLYENPLANIQPLLDNPGLDAGDEIHLRWTNVACVDVQVLADRGANVISDCP